MFKKDMTKVIASDISGDYEKLILGICRGTKPDHGVNKAQFPADIEILYKATEGKVGTDEAALINLVLTRSPDHLAQLNDAYRAKSKGGKSTFLQVLRAETSFSFRKCLEACFHDHVAYYAKQIHDACDGPGTKDQQLIVNVLLPNAYEMQRVVQRLKSFFKEDIFKLLKKELSGNYEKIMIKWVETQLAP